MIINKHDGLTKIGPDEYVNAYFRLETKSYYHTDRPYGEMLMFDNKKDREAFYDGISEALMWLGWSVIDKVTAVMDGSKLHIHPMYISGVIQYWQISAISERLAHVGGVKLRYVDVYKVRENIEQNAS